MTTLNSTEHLVGLPPVIETRLRAVRRRELVLNLLTSLVDGIALFLAILFVAIVFDWNFTMRDTFHRQIVSYAALGLGGLGLCVLAILPLLRRRTLAEVAGDVDRRVVALQERWQTVAEITTSDEPVASAGSPDMFQQVTREAVAQQQMVDVRAVVPAARLKKHQWFLTGAVLSHLLLFAIDPTVAWILMQRFWSPGVPLTLTQISPVTGDIVAARGEPVTLEAVVTRRPGKYVKLMRDYAAGSVGKVNFQDLKPSADDPTRYVYVDEAPEESYLYLFQSGDAQTAPSTVSVHDRPALTEVKFRITPPEYTKLPVVERDELPAQIRAVQDSVLEVAFEVDQPLERFRLEFGKDQHVSLAPDAGDPLQYIYRTQLLETIRFTPQLVSIPGLESKRLASCQVVVYVDKPPEVTVISPEKEVTVPVDDEVIIDIAARDDFAINDAELIVFTGDAPDEANAVEMPAEVVRKDESSEDPNRPDASKADADDPGADKTDANKSDGDANRSDGNKSDSQQPRKAEGQTPSAASAAENALRAATGPKTVRMPIPLDDQQGKSTVRTKIKIDLHKFGLKDGEGVSYMVRVRDSRNRSSQGQSFSPEEKPGRSPDSLASADPNAAQPGSNGQSNEGATTQDQAAQSANGQGQQNNANASNAAQAGKSATANNDSASQNAQAARDPSAQGRRGEQDAGKVSQSSSQSSQSGGGSPGAPASNQNDSQITGAPRPPDNMPRRLLDVGAQSACSATMRIQIDEWSGTFAGQQREKLEIMIDPVLTALDRALAKAIDHLGKVSEAVKQNKDHKQDEVKTPLRAADVEIERGESLVTDLVKKTDGTPYAFIGLQLVDIVALHVEPARAEVKAVTADVADQRTAHVDQAVFHLNRAREMLAELVRQYDAVKRDARLAENMQRIKKMYQVFVEDALALLRSEKPTLNPKARDIAELELDEEFLEKYTDLQKRWQKILAELAKALADDPRLRARYMNSSRRTADTLRDQLTILHERQKELLTQGETLQGKPAKKADAPKQAPDAKQPPGALLVRATLDRDALEISQAAVENLENLTTWLPRNIELNDPRIVPVRAQAQRVAAAAASIANAVANRGKDETIGERVEALAGLLKEYEAGLAGLAGDSDERLVVHANRRLSEVRTIQLKLAGWTQKNAHVQAKKFNHALELDQRGLAEDTLTLTDKLEAMDAQLAGLPDDILELGAELREIIRFEVLVDQMTAELSLRDDDLPGATEQQAKAVGDFAKAEEVFDKLIDRVIEEGDKEIPLVPDIDNAQLPTLEELLARLENEPQLAELLGIPPRPINLQQLSDWLMRAQQGPGVGSGNANLADRAGRDAMQRLRQNTEIRAPQQVLKRSRRWNTLASQLEDILRQSRGNTPPKQYRRAIEKYFEAISGAQNTSENAAPDAGNPTENTK